MRRAGVVACAVQVWSCALCGRGCMCRAGAAACAVRVRSQGDRGDGR